MTDALVLRLLRRAEGWPAASPADWAGRLASRASSHRSESFERLAARAVREPELFAGHAPLVVPARAPTAAATLGAGAAIVEPELRAPTAIPASTPPSNTVLLGGSVTRVAAGASSSVARASAAPEAPETPEAPGAASFVAEPMAPSSAADVPVVRAEVETRPLAARAEPAPGLSVGLPPVVRPESVAPLSTERPTVAPPARVERPAPPAVQRRAEPASAAPAPLSARPATPSPSPPLLRVVPTSSSRSPVEPGARWAPEIAVGAGPFPEAPPGRTLTTFSERRTERPLVVVAPSPPDPTEEAGPTPLAPAVVAPTAERPATAPPTELPLAAAPTTVTRTELAAALESLSRPTDATSLAAAPAEPPARPPAEPALDVDGLADRVYGLLVGRLAAERERRGL
jgi:hypothetical protein